MTDAAQSPRAVRQSILEAVAKGSGHELRNALNGLVVNLEVVRAQTAAIQAAVQPFMGQAVQQAEESIRLGEAAIALMQLIARSSPPGTGTPDVEDNAVKLEAGSDAERFEKALEPLVSRRVVAVERAGSAVILRIPDDSPE